MAFEAIPLGARGGGASVHLTPAKDSLCFFFAPWDGGVREVSQTFV